MHLLAALSIAPPAEKAFWMNCDRGYCPWSRNVIAFNQLQSRWTWSEGQKTSKIQTFSVGRPAGKVLWLAGAIFEFRLRFIDKFAVFQRWIQSLYRKFFSETFFGGPVNEKVVGRRRGAQPAFLLHKHIIRWLACIAQNISAAARDF